MRVLVTGATGFVGSRIVSELTNAGHEVVPVGGPRSSTHYSLDVASIESVENLRSIGSVDVVVHTAALAHQFAKVAESEFRRVNVNGVENVANLAALLSARHFLLFSSTLVYGRRNDAVVTEEMDCRPIGVYGQSKLDGELSAKRICEQNAIDLTIFRASPIVGEGGKGNFARLIEAIDRHRFVMVGGGLNRKSLIYVGDVAKAVAAVIEKGGTKTQVFNLTGENVRIIDIVHAIEKNLGKKRLPVAIPPGPVKLLVEAASTIFFSDRLRRISSTLDTWLADDVYSNEKLISAHNFEPETDIATAIKFEIAYYLKHK